MVRVHTVALCSMPRKMIVADQLKRVELVWMGWADAQRNDETMGEMN
jgi:hypothetical protein